MDNTLGSLKLEASGNKMYLTDTPAKSYRSGVGPATELMQLQYSILKLTESPN